MPGQSLIISLVLVTRLVVKDLGVETPNRGDERTSGKGSILRYLCRHDAAKTSYGNGPPPCGLRTDSMVRGKVKLAVEAKRETWTGIICILREIL